MDLFFQMNDVSKKLKIVFNAVDTSKNGFISWEEFQQCCHRMSLKLEEADKNDFHKLTVRQNDGIDFEGFVVFVRNRLKVIFQKIDADNSGAIDHDEIVLALNELGVKLSLRQIDGILQSMDRNRDKKIDFDEFYEFFSDLPSPNMRSIAMKLGSGEGLDYGSDVVPINMPPIEMPLIQFMMAGGIAGISSRTLTAPLEKIKIVTQVATKESIGIRQTFSRILRTEGFQGFFAGNLVNCIRVFPTSALVCLVYSRMIKYTPVDNEKNPNQPLWRFLSGVTAGLVSTTATHPLDVIRARFTVQASTTSGSKYTGIINAFTRITTEEGVRGLYKGLRPSLLSIAPFLGIQQASYDIMKMYAVENSVLGSHPSTFMVSGALAGMIAQTIIHPLDVIRRRRQVQTGDVKRTFLVALKELHREGGLPKVYAGLTASYLKVIPAAATSLLVRDFLLGRL